MLLDSGVIRILAVPVVAGLFSALPLRVTKETLIKMAMMLWLAGGLSLLITGAGRLNATVGTMSTPVLLACLAASVAVGIAKGRFVLGKSAKRNLDRLLALEGPQKLVQVYELRSWILIGVMLLMSASLTWFNAPTLWRGVVNVAVGLALIVSSRVYSTACCSKQSTSEPATAA